MAKQTSTEDKVYVRGGSGKYGPQRAQGLSILYSGTTVKKSDPQNILLLVDTGLRRMYILDNSTVDKVMCKADNLVPCMVKRNGFEYLPESSA